MAAVAVVVAWVALSVLVGLFAHNRGREPVFAVIAALALSPVFGFLLIVALKDKVAERRHAELLGAIRGDTSEAIETRAPRANKAIDPAPAEEREKGRDCNPADAGRGGVDCWHQPARVIGKHDVLHDIRRNVARVLRRWGRGDARQERGLPDSVESA